MANDDPIGILQGTWCLDDQPMIHAAPPIHWCGEDSEGLPLLRMWDAERHCYVGETVTPYELLTERVSAQALQLTERHTVAMTEIVFEETRPLWVRRIAAWWTGESCEDGGTDENIYHLSLPKLPPQEPEYAQVRPAFCAAFRAIMLAGIRAAYRFAQSKADVDDYTITITFTKRT